MLRRREYHPRLRVRDGGQMHATGDPDPVAGQYDDRDGFSFVHRRRLRHPHSLPSLSFSGVSEELVGQDGRGHR